MELTLRIMSALILVSGAVLSQEPPDYDRRVAEVCRDAGLLDPPMVGVVRDGSTGSPIAGAEVGTDPVFDLWEQGMFIGLVPEERHRRAYRTSRFARKGRVLGGHCRIEADGIAQVPARLVALTDRVKTKISLYNTDYAGDSPERNLIWVPRAPSSPEGIWTLAFAGAGAVELRVTRGGVPVSTALVYFPAFALSAWRRSDRGAVLFDTQDPVSEMRSVPLFPDAEGRVRLDNVAGGTWSVRIAAQDGTSRMIDVTVEPGKTSRTDVELP